MKIKKVKVGGGKHCIVACIINSQKTLALIDTGANVSCFHKKYNTGLTFTTFLKIGESNFAILNTNGNWNYSGLIDKLKRTYNEDITAILGMDILDGSIINLKKNTIVLK